MKADAAVIGAGPYGLSVAAHLRARNLSVRVFGHAMDTWIRHMPKGMFLKSEAFASNIDDPTGELTLRRYCLETGSPYQPWGWPVPLETFVGYGRWFQRLAVPDLEDVEVLALRHDHCGFVLELASGETVRSPRVVVATGLSGAAHLPPELRRLPQGLVSHTSEHSTLDALAGKRVAVIGGGQSALETAALIKERGGSVSLIVRKPAISWGPWPEDVPRPLGRRARAPQSPLGPNLKLWAYSNAISMFRLLPESTRLEKGWRSLGPGGAWWLRERLDEQVQVLTGHRILRAEPTGTGVRLSLENGRGGQELVVDHVIAGTGYRVRVDQFAVLSSDLRRQLQRTGDTPRLTSCFEASIRGLYFAGAAATSTFGPAMRFVFGSRVAARRIARHLGRACA